MIKAKNKLGLVFFPAYDWAISPEHPEREERLLYTQDQVKEEGLFDIDGITELNPGVAKEEDILRTHICIPDVSSRATVSHMISSGGAITAGEAVMDKKVDKAFAIIRPPGHHAHRVVWGDRGFCIINNEAVMIDHLREKYGDIKIAIVDTDCHHGDGTQDIFWNDKDTLFISLHQDGRTMYPGTGFTDELGGPNAYGYTLNVPLPPMTCDEGYLYVTDNLILPVLNEFKPDLIINSAGQDNHYGDPLTNMAVSAKGYAELNHRVNPDISVLEGGYSIEDALPYVNTGIILAMAGLDYGNVKEPDYNESISKQDKRIMDYIKKLCDIVYHNWTYKNELREKFVNGNNYIKRSRNIYYDTDGIMEYQTDKVTVCDDCQGLVLIETRAGYKNVFIVSISRNACDKCFENGMNEFQKNIGKYDYVYLQDKKNNIYITR